MGSGQVIFHLRHDVVLEPLIDRWFAWSHLIPPTTYAMNLSERHLKLMESFVAAPGVHAAALKSRNLRGGHFMDVPIGRVGEVKELLDDTLNRRRETIALCRAIQTCVQTLREEAKGYSMEPLYRATPEPLRGYVEYVYDISGRPDINFFEPLMYRSSHYSTSGQSILISQMKNPTRPFIMSTPRFTDAGDVAWDTGFRSDAIDVLSRRRTELAPWELISAELEQAGLPVDEMRRFYAAGPIPKAAQDEPLPRWLYFGHACLLLNTPDKKSILIDPFIGYQCENVDHYSFADLPGKIDLVLITHNHSDHVNIESLLAIRHRIGEIVVPEGGGKLQDPSLKLTLNVLGFENVRAVAAFDSVQAGTTTITAVPFLGEHADLDIRTKCAYHIAYGDGWSAMAVADSANLDPRLYEHIREALGPVETLFIGMECEGAPLSWVYGPLLCGAIERGKDTSRRLAGSDEDQAKKIAGILGCREVYVYAMGLEPWVQHVTSVGGEQDGAAILASNSFIASCNEHGLFARRLYGIDRSRPL
jgi:L-ascorbate metabolism protein UlaG (beta-lactamase superfamily)